MFDWLFGRHKEKDFNRLVEQTGAYVASNYISPDQLRPKPHDSSDVKYSRRDNYDSDTIHRALKDLSENGSPLNTIRTIEENTDVSFVNKMLELIEEKHLRDSDVYRAAQIDRRLFSKIVSDRTYKPAKDTCIALCFAMKLSLEEAKDLLSRAGYTFSHSSERDVILEFFFQEQVYNIMDINIVLARLDQKILGR